jgi:adenine-specific DNA-methyltransferase
MKQLDMQSPNIVSDNIEKIAALFPNCVTEGADGKVIDFDALRQELSSEIVEGNKERYRLEWPGKREAIVTANLPTQNTLRPIREDSVEFDTTENVYIEGDNLEVLKILQESYLGKIKMIYIDPPYNTGKDFVYKDNFRRSAEEELQASGQVDEDNQRLVVNPETAGRYHSDWLTMMYPRLKLARNLLTDDGVIFISIDDNEVHNLRKVCDEIFGEGNFVAQLIWERSFAPINLKKHFSENHDFILVYSKSINNTLSNGLPRTDDALKRYKNPDKDYRGVWQSDNLSVGPAISEKIYEITTPGGRKVMPPDGRCWLLTKKRYEEFILDNRIWFGENGTNVPRIKRFLSEVKNTVTPFTIWKYSEVGHSQDAAQSLKKLFDGKDYFNYPKSISLIERMVRLYSTSDSIILDFFSGSATSAHAVIQLNAEDKGKRKYIQVQLPEATDKKSEAYKAGYSNICEIGKERIRRAGKKIVEEQRDIIINKKTALEKVINGQLAVSEASGQVDNHRGFGTGGRFVFPKNVLIDETAEQLLAELNGLQSNLDGLDTGFRVYRLDSSNMKEVYYRPQDYTQTLLDNLYNNVKADRSAEDLLTQVLLDWGLPLSLPIERVTIAGKEVFKVASNSLYACFDENIAADFAKAIAKEKPLRVVFRDGSFKDDTAKVNVQQTLKQLSSETEMRVI